MRKRICLFSVLMFYSYALFSQNHIPPHQILHLKGVFVNETPISIDGKLVNVLSDILSKGFEIPYAVYHAKLKGTGKYKLIPQPVKIASVVHSLHPVLDSICMQQIKSEEFLKNLPFSYRAVKELTFSLTADTQHVPAKRINTLPLHLLGTSHSTLDTIRFSAMLSGKKDYAKAKKGGKTEVYEIQMSGVDYVISSGERYAARGKNKFTVEGSVWSVFRISKDSVLILARKGHCCDPVFLTEYALADGSLVVTSKTELYGLDASLIPDDKFKVGLKKNNGSHHYLKMNNEPLTFSAAPPCACPHVHVAQSVAGIKPAGNAAALLRGNAIIYHLRNSLLSNGLYGLVEVKANEDHTVYVGGWIE